MSDTALDTMTSPALSDPAKWGVTLHNDDFTPMEFVIALLMRVFHKPSQEAYALTMHVHEQGKARIGLYTQEIAQAKVARALAMAEANSHPLLATAEPA